MRFQHTEKIPHPEELAPKQKCDTQQKGTLLLLFIDNTWQMQGGKIPQYCLIIYKSLSFLIGQ